MGWIAFCTVLRTAHDIKISRNRLMAYEEIAEEVEEGIKFRVQGWVTVNLSHTQNHTVCFLHISAMIVDIIKNVCFWFGSGSGLMS